MDEREEGGAMPPTVEAVAEEEGGAEEGVPRTPAGRAGGGGAHSAERRMRGLEVNSFHLSVSDYLSSPISCEHVLPFSLSSNVWAYRFGEPWLVPAQTWMD